MQALTIFSACRARLSPISPSLARSLFQSSKIDPALSDLPDKVAFKTGPLGRASYLLPPRVSNKITTRVGSSFGGDHSLEWISRPQNVLIVKKRTSRRATEALTNVVRHIRTTYPYMNIILEESVQEELYGRVDGPITIANNDEKALLAAKTDFVITLGGDGTILHTSSMFDRDAVPPVLSFSMGTLGFLLPYSIGALGPALDELVSSRISLLLRMRLSMIVSEKSSQSHSDEIHLMNEVAIHRGREPHMTRVDAFVDGRHLTQAISDGLIISTPTGSTAYSLSAGGPIVHPSVQSLVLTPICPRSLSFRTVLLPSDSSVQLKLSTRSRSSASLTVDGRELRTLSPGDSLSVRMSPFPIPCVNCSTSTWEGSAAHADPDPPAPHTSFSESLPFSPQSLQAGDMSKPEATSSRLARPRRRDHWVRDVNTLLKFNASFSGRGSLGGHEDGDEADEEDLTAPPSPFSHRGEHQ